MAEIYSFLEGIMPVKRICLSLAIGMVSLFIVLFSGLTSDFVREETVASRTFSAFCFTTLWSFVLIMAGEEYAIFKSNRELEDFIDSAQIEKTGEDFNRNEYLGVSEEPEAVEEDAATDSDASQPLNFHNV